MISIDYPNHLALEDLVAIAEGAPAVLSEAAQASLVAAREVVEAHLALDAPVYGLNTMLGHLKALRLSHDDLLAYQRDTITGHDGGYGPPLPTTIARAAMAARLNGLVRGGAGASPGYADMLLAMLNAGVHPLLPESGSVGAADLMHLAAIGCVAIGEGRAEFRGEILPGAEALARAGLVPFVAQPKDALAVIASNSVSIGAGALAIARILRLVALADIALALSLEQIDGNLSIIDPAVAAAKPIAGMTDCILHLRALLDGSRLEDPAQSAAIQDPLSFRVGPQVHGALREAIRIAQDAVATELNARADNPVIDQGRMIPNGNFQPMMLVLAFDMLRTAMTHVAKLSERRMNHVSRAAHHDPKARWLQRDLAPRFRRFSFGFAYASASRIAQMRTLCGPSSLDVPPLDFDIEDHATNAPTGVFQTMQCADWLEDVLASELLLTWRALGISDPRRVGAGTRLAYDWIDTLVETAPDEGFCGSIHLLLKTRLPELARAVGTAIRDAA